MSAEQSPAPGRVRFDRSDFRFVSWCLLAILLGAIAFHFGFARAFPEASIDFKVTREQARVIAERALTARGFDLKGFRPLGSFDHDDEAKTFLERTLGLAKAAPLYSTDVPIWRWSFRWVKPLQKLEYRAFVSPTGQLLAFRRLLPETEAAPDPGEAAARRTAEATLRETRGLEASSLKFVETTLEKRPNRVDRSFIWESSTIRFGDAALRYLVDVQGDRAGRSSLYLEVPETWRKEYKTLRSKNEAAGTIATFFLFLTFVAILAVFVERVRRHDVRWRWAISFGAIGGALQLLSSLNELPISLFDYETSEAWGGFLAKAILGSIGGAFLLAVSIAMLVAAGEPLYRETYPKLPALGRIFSRRGIRSKTFFRGVLLGYAFTAGFITYQIVFYLLSEKLGAWSPADIPYSNLLGTSFPWLAVLVMGFMPATTEEFSSRMFSIPFVQRFLPTWAAVAIPAFIWGFAHSTYPNQPFFIRGLEVGLAGVVIGIAFVRVGILPVLVWHFTIDALYTALILIRSSNSYFVASGLAAALLLLVPVVISLVLYVKNGGFEGDVEVRNEAVGSAPPIVTPEAASEAAFVAPRPLARRVVLICGAAALLVIGVSRLILPSVDLDPKDGKGAFRIDRWEARRLADAFLKSQGDDPAQFLAVAMARSALPGLLEAGDTGADLIPYDWSDDVERWLLQTGGVPLLQQWATRILPGPVWQVRYMRPLDPHGAWIVLDGASGKIVGFRRTFPEAEAGASPEDPAARTQAAELLTSFGIDPADMKVVSSNAQTRKARRDHRIVFESTRQLAGTAPRRVVVELVGNKPALLATALKLPEAWVRARDRSTPATYVAIGWKVLGLGTLLGFFLVEFVRLARRGTIRWRRLLRPAALLTIPALLKQIVSVPLMLQTFRSEFSLQIFSVFIGVGVLLGLIVSFGLAFVALALISAVREPVWAAFRPRASSGPRAVLAAVVAVLLVFAARSLSGNLAVFWPQELGFGGFPAPPAINTLAPAVDLLDSAVKLALMLGAGAALATLLLRDFLAKAGMRAVTAFALVGLFAPISAHTLSEILAPTLASALVAFAFLVAIAALLKDDARAYLFTAVLLTCARGGFELVRSGVAIWVVNGAAVLACGLLVLLWKGLDRPVRSEPVILPAPLPDSD
ncbi:MAG: CPBP family intramembrane glutamic endopeptidase [Thermoanaerobaculia bacterium]